ncbi:MAG: peptidoglycan-binding protein [Clostridiales bacterium]|nr:peptidoglycan-binding protein [Clostridiales bacterium]
MFRPALRIGDQSAQVNQMNILLKSLGYAVTEPENTFGQRTQGALISFQNDHNISVTGIADEKTLVALERSAPMAIQKEEPPVKIMQTPGETGEEEMIGDPYTYEAKPQNGVQRDENAPQTLPDKTTAPIQANFDAFAGSAAPEPFETRYTNADQGFYKSVYQSAGSYGNPGFSPFDSTPAETVPYYDVIAGEPAELTAATCNPQKRPTLRRGSTGVSVTELQEGLTQLGYALNVDGIFGRETAKVVAAFQSSNGLVPDGIAGSKTWAVFDKAMQNLYDYTPDARPMLRQGSKGVWVKELQSKLNFLGFYKGASDGIFGPLTAQAVRDFQSCHHLNPDGIVGTLTWEAIDNALTAIPSPAKPAPDCGYGKPSHSTPEYSAPTPRIPAEHGAPIQRTPEYSAPTPRTPAEYSAPIQRTPEYSAPTPRTPAEYSAPIQRTPEYSKPHHTKPSYGTPDRAVLKNGSCGDPVFDLQNKLGRLGYYCENPDGVFGWYTEIAVRNFQRKNGLRADGVVGPETWAMLNQEPLALPPEQRGGGRNRAPMHSPGIPLRYGSKGDGVCLLQKRLKTLRFYRGDCHGEFDWETLTAVKNFQDANAAAPDGIVNRILWEFLESICSDNEN